MDDGVSGAKPSGKYGAMDYICFDAVVDAKETDVAKVPHQPNPRSQTLDLKRTGGEGVDVSKAMLVIIPIALIGIVASFAIHAYTLPQPSFR